MISICDLFDLTHTLAKEYLETFQYPWEALEGLSDFLKALQQRLPEDYLALKEGVFAHKTAKIAPTAYLEAPCIVGAMSEIRHCAFLRGSVLIGDGCVVGNSTEIKNSVLFDGVQAPHYNYIGDSILGYRAHMGAGAITSNLKADRKEVVIRCNGREYLTGRRKVGAAVGDFAEIGCNCVLNPGTVVGKNTSVYPLVALRGAYAADCIVKGTDAVTKRN